MQARYKLSNKNVTELDKRERGSEKGFLAATKTTHQNHPFLPITSQLKLFALFWTRNARLSDFTSIYEYPRRKPIATYSCKHFSRTRKS